MIAQHLASPPAGTTRTAAGPPPPCLIVNPRGFSASNDGLAARAAALALAHGAEVIEADRPAQLAAELDGLLARGTERVFVLAGDGTVQLIADRLARLPAGARLPQLLVLAGGRTNLTAVDLGGRRSVLKSLESALVRAAGGAADGFHVQYRHTLAIEQAPGPPRHGFFVAGALLDQLIRACHAHRRSGTGPFHTGRLSTAWCLLQLALRGRSGGGALASPELDITAPGCGRLRAPTRLLIATTLAHDRGLFHPYARCGEGVLRVTAVAARADGFWRSLPRLLTGRFSERMDPARGYLSGRCERMEVRGLAGYSLDGEEFETDPARPVVITAGPRLCFLTP